MKSLNKPDTIDLHDAVLNNQRDDIIRFLNYNGKNKNGKNKDSKNPEGKTALHLAIEHQKNDIALTLIRHNNKPDLNIQDKDGNTPLHCAIMKECDTETIRTILSYTDNIDLQNKLGNTALHLAVNASNDSIIEQLLEKKANLTIQNKDGDTPLMLIIKNDGDWLILDKINTLPPTELEAMLNIRNKDGETAYSLAKKCNGEGMA